jgi:hypothetical protein
MNLTAMPGRGYWAAAQFFVKRSLAACEKEARCPESYNFVRSSVGLKNMRRHDAGENLVNAVRTGDIDTLRAVLDRSPELANATTDLERRLRPSDALAMRLIHLAVAENQMAAAQLLIEHGANLNVRNADGRLPLHDCFELGAMSLPRPCSRPARKLMCARPPRMGCTIALAKS